MVGIVGGLLDLVNYSRGASQGIGREDYGAYAGNALQAVGAGCTVVAGGLALWIAGTTSTGLGAAMVHPIVGLIAVIGVGLSLLGTAAVSFLTYNDFEDFARRSFLAKEKNLAPQAISWSTKAFQLPAEEILTEVAVLHHLWCTFTVELERGADDALLMVIRPGLLAPDSIFELHVVRHYWDPRAMLNPQRLKLKSSGMPPANHEIHETNLRVEQFGARITQSVGIAGLAPLRIGSPSPHSSTDPDGSVAAVRISLEHVSMPEIAPSWPADYRLERLLQSRIDLSVRLLLEGHTRGMIVPLRRRRGCRR